MRVQPYASNGLPLTASSVRRVRKVTMALATTRDGRLSHLLLKVHRRNHLQTGPYLNFRLLLCLLDREESHPTLAM